MILNEGTQDELKLRTFLESDTYGRDYFDWDTLDELVESVRRLAVRGIEEAAKDGIGRAVGIHIIPVSEYADEKEDDEIG